MIFSPELIIETTSVCDRACHGCYAPNVVTSADTLELLKNRPNLFLSPEMLIHTLENLEAHPRAISLRGGEPTRHPHISSIIEMAANFSPVIYLETHARWALKDDGDSLLKTLAQTQAIVKISFDQMHGLTITELKAITDKLERANVDYLIAITEKSMTDFIATAELLTWIPANKIIFQQKATSTSELVNPALGIIDVNGELKTQLTTRWKKAL